MCYFDISLSWLLEGSTVLQYSLQRIDSIFASMLVPPRALIEDVWTRRTTCSYRNPYALCSFLGTRTRFKESVVIVDSGLIFVSSRAHNASIFIPSNHTRKWYGQERHVLIETHTPFAPSWEQTRTRFKESVVIGDESTMTISMCIGVNIVDFVNLSTP